MKQSGNSGMTLIELLAAIFAVSFLSSILLYLFLSGKAVWLASITRTANTQDLQVADLKIAQEMKQSDFATLTNNTAGTPQSFSFLSAVNNAGVFMTDPTGAPLWQKYVIYCIPNGTQQLRRSEMSLASLFPLSIPSPIPLLSPSQLSLYCSGGGTMLSKAMNSLSLSADTNPFLSVPLSTSPGVNADVSVGTSNQAVNLTLSLQRVNRLGKMDQQSRSIVIYMRNTGLLQQ